MAHSQVKSLPTIANAFCYPSQAAIGFVRAVPNLLSQAFACCKQRWGHYGTLRVVSGSAALIAEPGVPLPPTHGQPEQQKTENLASTLNQGHSASPFDTPCPKNYDGFRSCAGPLLDTASHSRSRLWSVFGGYAMLCCCLFDGHRKSQTAENMSPGQQNARHPASTNL